MASVNKIHLLGNLGRDPETKTFEGDRIKTWFSIATTKKIKDEKVTQWHNIVMWGKVAEIAAKYLKKGNPVYLEGEVTYRKYTNKDGIEVHTTEIVCNELQLISSGQNESAPTYNAPSDSGPLGDDSPPPPDTTGRKKNSLELPEDAQGLPF